MLRDNNRQVLIMLIFNLKIDICHYIFPIAEFNVLTLTKYNITYLKYVFENFCGKKISNYMVTNHKGYACWPAFV